MDCSLRLRTARPAHGAPAWRGGGCRKSRRALHRRLSLATAGSISGAIAIYPKPASAWLMRGELASLIPVAAFRRCDRLDQLRQGQKETVGVATGGDGIE